MQYLCNLSISVVAQERQSPMKRAAGEGGGADGRMLRVWFCPESRAALPGSAALLAPR